MPRKAKRTISKATRMKMSRAATDRQAKRRDAVVAKAVSLSAAASPAPSPTSVDMRQRILNRIAFHEDKLSDLNDALKMLDNLEL